MNDINAYLKLVEWSEEDQCFIGRVPGLSLGGIHGSNEVQVFEDLCKLVEEWITIHHQDKAPLPPGTAGRSYSGKFNLRVGKDLHEQLTIESLKAGQSLNQYCINALKDKIEGL
jgi:predicted HicB family RNase H-like nuclease